MHLIEKIITSFRIANIRRSMPPALQSAYTGFLEMITLGNGLPRVINGEPAVRIAPKYRCISETYEPTVCEWVKAHVGPGDIILDVGAQFGVYALLGSRWVQPGGKVYAFEPSPETSAALKRHITLNLAAERVEAVKAAVGAQSGTASMFIVGAHDHNTLSATAEGLINPEKIEVPVVTLDEFCAEKNILPRLVKIDTEGWELHVLRGARELLKRDDVLFVVEMHPYAWGGAGHGRREMEDFLSQHQLEAIPLTGQDDPLEVYGDTYLRHRAA